MIKYRITLLVVLFVTFSCEQKKVRSEKELMTCMYSSFSDEGLALKTSIANYEELLIKENILKDNSGESYMSFIEKIVTKEFDLKKLPSQSFTDIMKSVKRPELNLAKMSECAAISKDSINYDTSRLNAFNKAYKNTQFSSFFTENMLSVLDEEDFELNFYKFRLFNSLDYYSKQ